MLTVKLPASLEFFEHRVHSPLRAHDLAADGSKLKNGWPDAYPAPDAMAAGLGNSVKSAEASD